MRFGHFDDDRKEYVITRPDTPRSWSNYLGSTRYGAIITNNAGGYSFFHSAAQGRFLRLRFNSIPLDQPGRYFYLRDQEDGDFWSTSWQPVGKPLADFGSTCRHGTGYTIITSRYRDLESESTYFVPRGADYECWLLRVTNQGNRPRRLSAFTYCEFANNWSTTQDLVNLQFSQYCLKASVDGRMMHVSLLGNLAEDPHDFQNNDQSRHLFMALQGIEPAGFDTDREQFLGPYRSYDRPLAVERGRCGQSRADGDNGCGVWQADFALAPGESRELLILLGVGRPEREGRAALAAIPDAAAARAALRQVQAYWHGRLGALTVQTPDPEFDSMVNVWAAYNCHITYAWSRAASLIYNGERDGLGYRDTVQDLLGVMASIPDEARQRLELMLTGQVASGGALSVVKPFAHRPGHERTPAPEHYRSDDCLWLFNAVPEYVKETGDLAFYDRVLPYADQGEASVLGHLKQALLFNLERTGQHGLPCGLEADWNDCLRLGYRGESVFVTFQVRYGLRVYRDVCRRLGRTAEGQWAEETLARLDRLIQQHTWDGEWFLRAYREDGGTLGSHRNEEGFIFLEPQPWSVISGAATPEQGTRAMASVQKHLDTAFGARICEPPFVKTPHHVVRAVLINPGQKENGGIFCHTQGWVVIAEAMLGHHDRAYERLRAYWPAACNERAEVREIEPYVFAQSTHAPASGHCGASRLPWLSGTASWSYYAATQYIVGLRPEEDGLRVEPHLPTAWKEIRATRRFRGKTLRFHMTQAPGAASAVQLVLNGTPCPGPVIPFALMKDDNDVRVEITRTAPT
jgi:N,N'-diacetylchitobiose phosphorylase